MSSQDLSIDKYLKYKLKYLSLKNELIGGNISDDNPLRGAITKAQLSDLFIGRRHTCYMNDEMIPHIIELHRFGNEEQKLWATYIIKQYALATEEEKEDALYITQLLQRAKTTRKGAGERLKMDITKFGLTDLRYYAYVIPLDIDKTEMRRREIDDLDIEQLQEHVLRNWPTLFGR